MLIIFIERKTKGEVAKDERYRREKTENKKSLYLAFINIKTRYLEFSIFFLLLIIE